MPRTINIQFHFPKNQLKDPLAKNMLSKKSMRRSISESFMNQKTNKKDNRRIILLPWVKNLKCNIKLIDKRFTVQKNVGHFFKQNSISLVNLLSC